MSNNTTADKPFLVVKIGGRPASSQDTLDALVAELGSLGTTYRVVLVHGGGADVSEMSRRLGLEPVFVNGLRQTTPPEMQVVEMVLAGSVNTRILRRCLATGVRAIGLGGADAGLFRAVSVDPANDSRTGRITDTDTRVLEDVCGAGYLAVVSSVCTDAEGTMPFNVNADDAAMAAAIALQARALVFLSDIPGIMKDGQVMLTMDSPKAEAEIAAGVISGGMIPKVRSSLAALDQGVGTVVIGGYQESGDLRAFLDCRKGSSMVARA